MTRDIQSRIQIDIEIFDEYEDTKCCCYVFSTHHARSTVRKTVEVHLRSEIASKNKCRNSELSSLGYNNLSIL